MSIINEKWVRDKFRVQSYNRKTKMKKEEIVLESSTFIKLTPLAF